MPFFQQGTLRRGAVSTDAEGEGLAEEGIHAHRLPQIVNFVPEYFGIRMTVPQPSRKVL